MKYLDYVYDPVYYIPRVSLLSVHPLLHGHPLLHRTASGLDLQAAEGASRGPPNTGALARSHPEQVTEGLSPFPKVDITKEGDREGWET